MFGQAVATLRQRLASTNGGRGDLYLADAEILGPRTARLLVGFATTLGAPKTAEVDAFLHKQFGTRVSASLESIRVFDQTLVRGQGAVSLLVAQNVATIPVAKAAEHKLVPATPLLFTAATGEKWDMTESQAGPVLMRREAEDLEAILQERMRRQALAGGGFGLRFASVDVKAGRANVMAGDEVRIVVDGSILRGVASGDADDEGNVTVKAGSKSYRVSKEQVVDVVRAGNKSRADASRDTREFFGIVFSGDKSLGKQMAQQISDLDPPSLKDIAAAPGPSSLPKDWPLPKREASTETVATPAPASFQVTASVATEPPALSRPEREASTMNSLRRALRR